MSAKSNLKWVFLSLGAQPSLCGGERSTGRAVKVRIGYRGLWGRLCSRAGSCSCPEPSVQPCWQGECERIPLHLRKLHFWGAHFTPLCDFLLTNLVWCSVFRFRTLFCKMLWSEIFEILLRIITLKIMLSDICKQIVPLVSLVVPNALLHLTGF